MIEIYKNPGFSNGFIYVLSNPSMPNIYKVGLTTNSIKQRIQELNSTGVPRSFELVKKYEVEEVNLLAIEKLAHKKLKKNELHHGKEFFEGPISLIENIVEDSIFEITGNSATELVGFAKKRKDAEDRKNKEDEDFEERVKIELIKTNNSIDSTREIYISKRKNEIKENKSFLDKYFWEPLGFIIFGFIGVAVITTGVIGWIIVGIATCWIYNENFVKPNLALTKEAALLYPYKTFDQVFEKLKSGNGNNRSVNIPIFGEQNNLKFWYIFRNKLWNKLDNSSFLFDKSLSGMSYKINSHGSKPDLTVELKNIDFIKYENNSAIVHCPKCSQKCRLPRKPILDVICPKCKKVWRQNFEIQLK